MHPNIRKLYLMAGFEGIVFYYVFDKIFMQLRGLNIVEIILIDIIYTVAALIFEVPSGALSDRWSRKYVLVLHTVFFGLNTIIFAISHSFAMFAFGVVLAALHKALRSGTDTSLLFDSLLETGEDEHYEKYIGRKRAIGATTFIGAAALGGVIGQRYGLEAAFWWTLPSVVLAGLVALTLKEPKIHRSTGEISYWRHIGETISFLRQQPRFFHVAGILTAIMVPTLIFDEYSQVYFSFVGVSALGLGLLGALNGFFDALFNSIAVYFKRFRHDELFGVMFLIMSLSYIAAWRLKNPLGIALLFLGSVTFYVVDIIAMADVNRQLPSKIRATSESFFSFLSQVFLIPTALTFAWISQKHSIAAGFGFLGGLMLTYTMFYWFVTFRHLSAKGKITQDTL